MRTMTVLIVSLLFLGSVPGFAAEESEEAKWAAEGARDDQRMGQSNTTISAVGRLQLTQRQWSAEDRQQISKIDAGLFLAKKMLGRKGWVDRAATLQVRLADARLLDWLRKNPNVRHLHVQGHLRVDGKYFLIEDCRPAMDKPVVAPAFGRGKRGGM